ncbi:ChbG/HpnK family deacetylase, partial [Escherichia coli]|nr:ChbG/HpnK family deacetylase [Escherichia coli]
SLFLQVLDDAGHRGDRSLEVMCHPAFVDNIIRQSAYCYPRLTELEVLTSASLKAAIAERGYRPGSFLDI